jgi:hypothetical protein
MPSAPRDQLESRRYIVQTKKLIAAPLVKLERMRDADEDPS